MTFAWSTDKILSTMFNRMCERGFIFLELAIGLPLMLMMLWAMAHLFANTWKECRNLIADFTMQLEINNAMQRIVSDLKAASSAKLNGGRLEINSWLYQESANPKIFESKRNAGNEEKRPIYYFHSRTTDATKDYVAIYRQRQDDAKDHPITGEDLLSDVSIRTFKHVEDNDREGLWDLEITATSRVSGHKFELRTKVYVRGDGS